MAQQPSPKTKQPQILFSNLSEMKRDIIFVAILYLIVLFLFNKIAFNNMMFSDSGDTAAAQSWTAAGNHIHETEKVDALWIPYAFSGMPGLGSLTYMPHNVNYLQTAVQTVGKLFFLNADWSWILLHILLGGIFMYFAGRELFPGAAGQLPSLLGAITFMLNPFFIGLAEVGHGSKLMALSYIPLLFLLTHHLFQRRDLMSLGLLAITVGTSLLTNHVQMVFYGFMVIGCYTLWEIISEIKKQPKESVMRGVLFAAAIIIGFAISAYVYLAVEEYSKFSIRGGTGTGTGGGGLDYDYATNWSFHPLETLTYFIPSFFGYETPYYWGWKPFTNSTVYIGLVPLFLGILALIYKRNRITLFLAVFSLFVMALSWGRHLPLVYDLMFNYFPFFNKFRVPDMVLHLIPFTFGLLSLYGYNALIEMQDKTLEVRRKKLFKILRVIVITLGAGLVLGFVAKDGINSFLSDFMFKREDDLSELQRQYGEQARQILPQLYTMRFDMLWEGYVKFAILGSAVLGLLMAFLNNKIKPVALTLGLFVLLCIDLIILDVKYINPKPNTALNEHFTPDETVQFLLNDKSQFRVYQVGGFMDNTYMYHKLDMVGGYSPAKIKIYQEMIDSIGLHPPRFPLNISVVDMLNAKYLVVPGRLPLEDGLTIVHADQQKGLLTYRNNNFLPRAWFVDGATVTGNKTELFNIMRSSSFNPRTTALLEKQPAQTPVHSDSTSITQSVYKSREIAYDTYNSQTSLLVFSEVYYPAGWKAYIDGQEAEIYKTNFVLRSVIVPAGNHKIEMKFDPPLYQVGYDVTLAGWGISILLVVVGVVRGKMGKKKEETKKEE